MSTAIRCQGVTKTFRSKAVLRGVDLEVQSGETLVLLGGSGSGKSVLLKHLNGLLRPDAGSVEVEGTRLDTLDVRLGDAAYAAAPPTPRARLDAIGRALPSSGLSTAARAQLQVEYEDLARLESAYSRLTTSADEQAYLDRRLSELEDPAAFVKRLNSLTLALAGGGASSRIWTPGS